MAPTSDIHKWVEHALILKEYGNEILPALHAAKQILEPTAPYFYSPQNEEPPAGQSNPPDPCGCSPHRSIASEYEFTHNDYVFSTSGPMGVDWRVGLSKPPVFNRKASGLTDGKLCQKPKLRYVCDPALSQIFKFLQKKFPEDGGSDFMKVLLLPESGHYLNSVVSRLMDQVLSLHKHKRF